MKIDTFASEEHFADHLLPVYDALRIRGDFLVTDQLLAGGRWRPARTNHTDPSRPVLVASNGDLKRMRKMGRTKIAFMEHGAGQSYGTKDGSYAGGSGRDDVGLFLVPNEYSANLWRATYPNAQVEIVGCPKLDTLPAKTSGPVTVAIGFHWDCRMLPETSSAFGHYRSVLPKLAQAFNLIGHGHPRAVIGPPFLERQYRRMNIPFVRTFTEVCQRADVYICDNSSSMFEFAATGRPVVVLNAPWYRRTFHPGLRFWDAADVGIQVDEPGELIGAVKRALVDSKKQQKARERALRLVYTHRSGGAKRAAEALTQWIQEKEQAA